MFRDVSCVVCRGVAVYSFAARRENVSRRVFRMLLRYQNNYRRFFIVRAAARVINLENVNRRRRTNVCYSNDQKDARTAAAAAGIIESQR